MGDLLDQVKTICCQLDDNKITTRKKAEEQLRHLLNNNSLLVKLDRVSSEGGGRDWAWQDVYRTTFSYLKKEVDKIVEDMNKEKQSKTALANRDSKKRSVIGMYRMVVKKGRKHLSWSTVLNDLFLMLDQPYMRNNFSEDIVRMLVEAVTDPTSRSMVRVGPGVGQEGNQWVRLFNTVAGLYADPPPGLDSLAVCQLLHQTIRQGTMVTCMQAVLIRQETWILVKRVLISDKVARPESEAKLECIRAANCLLWRVGLDCREKAIMLGEDTVQTVIRSWGDRKDGSEAVLEFLSLQIVLHHPGGAHDSASGALYNDRSIWTRQLKRIFQNIVETTIKNRVRQCRQKNSRQSQEFELSKELVELGVSVIYQLIKSPGQENIGEVTQIVQLDATQQGPAKKRRMSSDQEGQVVGVEMLLRELQLPVDSASQDSKIPWLQLLKSLVSRYPDVVRETQDNVVRVVVGLLQSSRSVVVRRLVLSVIREFVVMRMFSQEMVVVGRSVVSMVSCNQAGQEGHSLVRTLLGSDCERVITPGELYAVYTGRMVRPCTQSMETLIFLLDMFPVREGGGGVNRGDLLAWIGQETEREGEKEHFGPVLAKLLVKLVMKKDISENLKGEDKLKSDDKCKSAMNEFEERVLEIVSAKIIEVDSEEPVTAANLVKPVLLPDMLEAVQEFLIEEAGEVLDRLNGSQGGKVVESTLRLAQTVLCYMSGLTNLSTTSKLATSVRHMLAKAGEATEKVLNKRETRNGELIPILKQWICIMRKGVYSQDIIHMLHSKESELPSLVSKLEWLVGDICQARDKQGVGRLSQVVQVQTNINGRGSPDPFDDFEDFSVDSLGNVEESDLELTGQVDSTKEALDLEIALSCLAVLSTFSSPLSIVVDTSIIAGRQVKVVELLMMILDKFHYNDASIDLVFPTCKLLVEGNLHRDTVVEMADLLKEMARKCMTRTIFNYPGILVLVKLLALLAAAFDQHSEQACRGVYLKLVQGLVSQNYYCGLNRLGPDIMVQLVTSISELDRLGATWASWNNHNKVAVMESPMLDMDTDEDQLIGRCLPRFLAARPAVIRLTAAKKLLQLATSSKLFLLQNILFPAIRASFQVESDSSSALAGSASALLTSLTFASPGLARSVVSCLISLNNNQNLSKDQLKKAVQLVADNRNEDHCTFVKSVLGGLLVDHFEEGGKLSSFPRHLLGYEDEQLAMFVSNHEGVVVPLALLYCPTEATLAQLSTMVGKQPPDILKHNFDKLAQYFLPGMAAKEFKFVLHGSTKMEVLADFIHDKYPGDSFLNLVLKNFPSTMQQMFINVNDPTVLKSTFQLSNIEKVSSNPPELSAELPTKVGKLLQDVWEDNIWQLLSNTKPESIVKIAVTLTSNLSSSSENNLYSLHSLFLWLDCVGPSINDQMLAVLPFLTQYLCSSLLKLINPQKNDLSVTKSSLIVLKKLFSIITPIDSSSLFPLLFSINYCLVSLIFKSCPADIASITVEILEYLFIQNGFRFSSLELEDYPDNPIFSNLQAALDKQVRSSHSKSLWGFIDRILKVISTTNPLFLELPLATLKGKLQGMSSQLLDLVKSTSVPRDLVCALVNIVRGEAGLVGTMALQCLAEIGPVDLQSQVLEFKHDYGSPCSQDPTVIVLDHLKNLLLSNDGLVTRTAAQAVTNILSHTEEGHRFLEPVDEKESKLKILQELLQPFQKQKTRAKLPKSKDSSVDEDLFRAKVDNPNIWSEEETHSNWLTTLVHQMLSCFHEKTVLSHLLDICQMSLKMCHAVLPFIVHQLLLFESTEVRLIISAKFCKFFQDHFDSVSPVANIRAGSPLNKDEEASPPLRKESVQVMLSVVSYLREQSLPDHLKSNLRESNCWENNFWLANINYLHCAQAALSCGAYFTAIQMCNIWCYERAFQMESEKPTDHLEGNLLENIVVKFGKNGNVVQDILYQASVNLGDKDGALGAGRSRLTHPATRTAQLALEGKFGIALPLFDSQALSMDGPARQGLVTTLYSSGMHYVLSQHLAGGTGDMGEGIAEFQQECCWRLENWDQFSPEIANKSFHGCVLGGLESAVRGDHGAVRFWKQAGEKIIAAGLSSSSLESTAGIYQALSQLRQLAELESLAGQSHSQETFTAIIQHLIMKDEAATPDFMLIEPVLTQRLLLLSSSKWAGAVLRNTVRTCLDKLCLTVSERARQAQVYWVCNQLQRFYSGVTYTSRLEEAMVAYGQDQKETGIFLAKKLLLDIDTLDHPTEISNSLLPNVLLNLGNWLNQQKSEPCSKILDTYLARTVQLLEAAQNPDKGELTEAHMAVARFADQQYKQVTEYMDSTEFQERMEAIKRNTKEAEILTQAQKKQKTLSTARVLKERFSNLDTAELDLYRSQSEEYLNTALTHYLAVLCHGDKTLAVYRLVSLWFSNSDCTSVQDLLAAKLPSVPSHKFIPLLYQMAARMQVPRQGDQTFSGILFSLMKRCSVDHPHHAIPIALALANAKEDERQESGSKAVAGTEDPRTEAAEKLVGQVEKILGMEKLVKRYRYLSKSLISLAYVTPPANVGQGSSVQIPTDHHLLKIAQWQGVAVPTDTLLVRADRDYSGVCGIAQFSTSYSMVGGVNAPKKMSCTGTDGRRRLQLVKGKDDLRQDAVMEQVFGLMNHLLDQNEEARKNKLNVRTYKVVPLSQRSGILEWCDNTQPIAMFLVGHDQRSGAHKKYAPKQLDSYECRRKMSALNPKNARRIISLKMKEKVFREVCASFPPAMKYFFLEKFASPGSYLLAQSSYTRSVATNSMVGHVLGLGDRHTNNILIDNSSGEMVHIDLGVAFEQGKILPTPENIPFRLTRDIVDGFGPAGIEGVFRKCCERSMGVLRENKSAILTVLEVLVHDPLYNWSVGPEKAAARQEAGQWEELQKETGQENRMANRALLVLAAKLEGREEGASLSVEGQVSTLIQKATDPANLCSVFEGWAAWC